MNKKELSKKKKEILGYFKKWKKLLKLEHWSISIDFKNEKYPDNEECKRGELRSTTGSYELVMITIANPYYLEAVVTVYCPPLFNYSDKENEESVIHELMHIIVSPLSPNKKTLQEESVVTLLARSFLKTEDILSRKK